MQDSKIKTAIARSLGKVVLKLRQEANLSARTVSYGINLSKTTILLAEQGKLNPQLSTFFKIAEAYYRTPDELIKMVMDEMPEDWDKEE